MLADSSPARWNERRSRSARRADAKFDTASRYPNSNSLIVPLPHQRTPTRYVAPFNLAFNTRLGLFPCPELQENEDGLVRFGHRMVGTCEFETKNEIL